MSTGTPEHLVWPRSRGYIQTCLKKCRESLRRFAKTIKVSTQSSTRGRGKVLEKTGGQMSVRGTRQRAVIFLLWYLEI